MLVNFDNTVFNSQRWQECLFLLSYILGLLIWFATVWAIWKEMNNRVFQNTVSDPANLIEIVKRNSYLWLRSKQVAFAYSYHDWWKHPTPCMGVLL